MLEIWIMDIALGVIATLIGSILVWVFSRKISQDLTDLNVSTSEVFAWLMAFCILIAIVSPFTDSMLKPSLIVVLIMIVIPMVSRVR